MTNTEKNAESFRDKISTVDKKGKRVWIYPKKPFGNLHRARSVVAVILLAILFGGPFITINGRPLLLLDILNRNFVIFGVRFWPQDIHLFVLGTIALIVFVVLFTVVFGRIWCGWACPQTIFMEMLFRKIEYWIEGDAAQQRKLNQAPWTGKKIFKKLSKHFIFFAISFIIGNTFLAYIIGKDALFKIISDPPSQHLGGLTAMIIFSAVFYWIYAFFREQVCTLVCPYGRLQGVLLDPQSTVVIYDYKRGEPRGKRKKSEEDKYGDCIDCNQCVDVCPTGIDIRNGTQLECVNCTACIDACNNVMDKINKPRGLIRYDSYKGVENREKLRFTPRMMGYTAILTIIIAILTIMLMTRSPVETTILRTPGVMYQELADGKIANLYNVMIVNKTYHPMDIRLQLDENTGEIEMVGGKLHVAENATAESSFFIKIAKQKLRSRNIPVEIEVYSGNELLEKLKTSFIGPQPSQKRK
ncbi:MAG TPA: cytochrome c oxidase accessory protein CcoG [Calditrichaeota bacterium]|nr:cytochrome c oxidase accessory protein CcoG [Calditrichota bacterium]